MSSTYESCGCVYRSMGDAQCVRERTCEKHMRNKEICSPEIRQEALKAIEALNNLVIAGVKHENITNADFLVNAWFDAIIGEGER